MLKFGIYIAGLLVLLAAVYVLLTQTGVSAFVPLAVIVVVLLALLGLGLMRATQTVDESPREITETKQQVGDTQVRRSKVE